MTNRKKEYIQKEFKQYLTGSEEGKEYYTISLEEPFDLIKIYKHLFSYLQIGTLSELYIKPSKNKDRSILSFTLVI